jgi:hypothetical protein
MLGPMLTAAPPPVAALYRSLQSDPAALTERRHALRLIGFGSSSSIPIIET